MNTIVIVTALLSAPVMALLGVVAGAWLYHCGAIGRNPVPRAWTGRITRLGENGQQQAKDEKRAELPRVRA